MKTVYIGNAVGDENGKASGGEAGNQNGKELRTQPWYRNKKGWVVLRPTDEAVAEKLVYDMKAACNNTHIGYDQSQRNTLYTAASKVGFDCAKVTTPCECDCSSLVRVCLAYAGIKVSNFNTESEVRRLMATGRFIELTEAKYTEKPDYLMAGDILVTKVKGHTAIVLNDGDKAEHDPDPEPQPVPEAYVYVKGGSVYVRTSDSVAGAVIGVAHRGDKLPYLGTGDSGWYHVEFKGREGYISNKPRYTEVRYEHT